MLIAKNKTLNIRLTKPTLDHFIDAALFFYLFVLFTFNHVVAGVTPLYYISFFLFTGLSIVKVLLRIRLDGAVRISGVTLWYAAILLYSLVSVLWADYPSKALESIVRMMQIVFVLFCLSQTYATYGGVERFIKLMAGAASANALYIFLATPASEWLAGGLGETATGQNTNTIAMVLTVTALFTAYLAYYRKQRAYYLLFFLQAATVVLTSSRKSVIAVCIGIVMLAFLKDRSVKLLLRILIVLALLSTVIYAIMNIPELYYAIGRRFESMVKYFSESEGDNSIYKRRMFMQYARQFFLEHPIFGNGNGSFTIKIGIITGRGTYSHNNYYEILVSFGLVGFLLYYGMYTYIFAKLGRAVVATGNDTAKLFLTVMTVICICEFGIVLYYQIYAMIFVCAAFLFVCAYDNSLRQQPPPLNKTEYTGRPEVRERMI